MLQMLFSLFVKNNIDTRKIKNENEMEKDTNNVK
jgi:hypothetical protein